MQINFRFLNYHTEYSAEGPCAVEMNRRACYGAISGSLVRSDKITQTYHIRLYTSKDSPKRSQNNYLFVDINKYLNLLKEIVPFEYTITDEPDNGRVVLNLNVTNTYGVLHFFLLTWIRPLYEWPYNFMLYDALHLYESGECPGLNILDCFNLCYAVSNLPCGGGHSCLTGHYLTKPMSPKEIYNQLKHNNRLNYVYKDIGRPAPIVDLSGSSFVIENFMNFYHKRHPKYVENYQKILKYV